MFIVSFPINKSVKSNYNLVTECLFFFKIILTIVLINFYRAMAVCISLMLGRIGSVTGSNVMGALIETHCETALYSSSIALILAGCLGFLMPKTQDEKKSINDNETISIH